MLTNAHNVHDDTVTVTFADGRTADAAIAGIDPDGDLAVLEAATLGTLPLSNRSERPTRIGTPVVALGSGVGMAAPSHLWVRELRRSIIPRAPWTPGDGCGGAHGTPHAGLIRRTRRGHRRPAHRHQHQPPGTMASTSPSPPMPRLRDRVAALGRGEATEQRRLGVGLAPGHAARRLRRAVGLPERDGVLVRLVEDKTPAAAAGIAKGDLIVAINGQPIRDADDLLDALARRGPLDIMLIRGIDERTVQVTE